MSESSWSGAPKIPTFTKASFAVGILLFLATGYSITQIQKNGPQGPQGNPGPAGPPGPIENVAPIESEIADFQAKLASLQQQNVALRRLGLLQICQQRLASLPSGKQFSALVDQAREEAIHPENCPPGSGWPYCPLQIWHDDVRIISSVTGECYPKQNIDLDAEPTPEQMDTKTSNEPTGLDVDQTRRYRRFFYQMAKAANQLNRLNAKTQQEIEALGAPLSK